MTSLTVQVTELTVNQKHILEAIKYLDERIKDIIANTNNDNGTEVKDIITRQEKIDKIVVNNSEDILKLKKTKEETAEAIKCLEQKVRDIDKDFEEAKTLVKDKEDTIEVKSNEFGKTINCNQCDKSYDRFVDLEVHIKNFHEKHPGFKCDQCEKVFSLKWRLKKHLNLHSRNYIKCCHYFNNNKHCPYEEYGCKFLHTNSKNCVFGKKCRVKLCPFKHNDEKKVTLHDFETYDVEEIEVNANDTAIEDAGNCSLQDISNDNTSFATSTPSKRKFECRECKNVSQCVNCFVDQYTIQPGNISTSPVMAKGPKLDNPRQGAAGRF